jgi:hypothetical protein
MSTLARNPLRLRRLATACLLTALLATLAACTGTREDLLPTLLVVGSVDAAGASHLMIVEDVFDPGATPARTLIPVVGSERLLPAPPISLDVTDRNGARDELVVLVRDDDLGLTALHFFDLSELDPTDPASFTTSRSPVNVGALLMAQATSGAPVCLSEVQVGAQGRYAALLDDGACRDNGLPEIYVVDLVEGEHLYSVSTAFPVVRPLAAGIFVDQSRDLLYFATGEIGATQVRAVPLTGGTEAVVGETDLELDGAQSSDLAAMADGIGLLADGDLSLVRPQAGAPARSVDSEIDADILLADPTGNLAQLVAFSESKVAIFAGPEDDDPLAYSLRETLVDATLEPVQLFAYLLEEGGIEILDLFPYAEEPSNRLLFVPLGELTDPRVITWAYAVREAP